MRRSKLQTFGARMAMAALTLLSPPTGAASFNYLYIEASEGNSSGGHTAIQFDDDIYHYQHVDPGLIRLFRQEEDPFHFLYRYLQNRPMHLSRVEVSNDTLGLLKDQFKWQFLIQERQFRLLDDLHRDRIFIQYLLRKLAAGHGGIDTDAASLLRLKGVGLFYPVSDRHPQHINSPFATEQSQRIQRLRQKVEQRYGRGFLKKLGEKIEAQIKGLSPTDWSTLNSDLAGEKPPPPTYSFTENYADNLTALFAIKTLIDAPPMHSDTILQIHQQAFKVSETERRNLQDLKNTLETGLIKSFDLNRPDWGYAVLVDLARYLAIDASLQSGYWVFIDDFADSSERVGPDQYLEYRAQLQTLINDARQNLNQLRQSASSQQRLTEADYSQIEMAANHYSELLKSEQHRDFRFNGEKALPSKSVGFPDDAPLPDLTREQLASALSILDQLEGRLAEQLKQNYRYDLISRNCVTELFRTINQALLAPFRSSDKLSDSEALVKKESEKRLGGYIEIPYNFIPFVSYQAVRDHYHVIKSLNLDSYRGLELSKLRARQNELVTALRESNILSSRLYQYNPDDALFMFFTDDNAPLRPLFGVFNTAAGIGQSIYGFFSLPLDSGKNLKSGATGILMSLPELFFFNMRKGSYKYLSFHQMPPTDLPDH